MGFARCEIMQQILLESFLKRIDCVGCASHSSASSRREKEICSVCRINPIRKDDPLKMCTACFLDAHPEVREQIEASKVARAAAKRKYNADQAAKRRKMARKHPCKLHRVRGICGLSKIGSQCQYSARKAERDCGEFERRVKAA